jgi:signal transduction histidine kinase/DNA-binding response OmpR family regulator
MDLPRLLVVDDEETVCQVFERTLGKKNYEVQTTQNANKALEEIKQSFFNLMIIDLKMPGMDGIQLLKRIKKLNPYIEVIILTGFGTTDTAVSAMKLGAFDYITKPFNFKEIEKIIQKCLEKQKLTLENVELKELIALFETSKIIVSTRNLDDLLEKILDSSIQVTKAKKGSLLLVDEKNRELKIKSARGLKADIIASTKLFVGEGISGWVAREGKPVLVTNIEQDKRFKKTNDPKYETKSFMSAPLVSVPFVFQGKVLGVVNVSDKISGEAFTKRDLTLLSVLTSQGAIAIENAKLYSQLQNKVKELEQSIKGLNQAKEQLIRSEKLVSIGRLASGIVHEICNPLNVISGHVQLLMMDIEKDSSLIKSLKIIEDNVARTSRIANNLLKFAKPSQLEISILDVNQLLEEALSMVAKRIYLKNIKMVKNFASSLPDIFGDSQQLQQVFLNIILNAEQSMSDGGDLIISTNSTPEKNFVEISFQDTGCGIPQCNINRIFDPFFTAKQGGRGLGLSVSYGIIKMHKGTIDVESKEGEGSTFTIKLPVTEVSQEKPLTTENIEKKPECTE